MTDQMFPSFDQYRALKQKKSSHGWAILSAEEKLLNRTYNYAWQDVVAHRPWPTDNDPQYNAEMVEQAKQMFREGETRVICRDKWGTCARRWDQVGFICQSDCRTKIPGYYPRHDLDKDLSHNHKLFQYFLAAVYRAAHRDGQPLPAGLDPDDPQVQTAIAKYHAEICDVQTVAAEIVQERHAMLDAWREELGVKATEQAEKPDRLWPESLDFKPGELRPPHPPRSF